MFVVNILVNIVFFFFFGRKYMFCLVSRVLDRIANIPWKICAESKYVGTELQIKKYIAVKVALRICNLSY